ncbi:hypothetical protein LTR78_001333 [Recurvomyces mirabilis]|uniref:rRNA methyltransferase 1, mitochondrial n=1 Tax=Recurvomyces mirabilis TaxID=574656 RepID=A0AAE0WVZ0_9PEZI|nr:hypothetical protein LTR78_001333 [Recurvomyces mirabilis]KAK5161310.1 hypothetical protein LTS14_001106 [Recurvomyces mirabilis]
MFLPNAGRTLYLDLYHIVRTHTIASPQCRRSVSTTSAINRGIRASRDTRSRSRDGGRLGGRDRTPVAAAPTTRDRASRLRGDGFRGTAFARNDRAAAASRDGAGRRPGSLEQRDPPPPPRSEVRRSSFSRDRGPETREQRQWSRAETVEPPSFQERRSRPSGRTGDRTPPRISSGRKTYEADDDPPPRYGGRERVTSKYTSHGPPKPREEAGARRRSSFEEDDRPVQRYNSKERDPPSYASRESRKAPYEAEKSLSRTSRDKLDQDRSFNDTRQPREIRPPRNVRDEAPTGGAANTYDRSSKRRERDANKEAYESPMPIPYTTAASQFLYGTNVVHAALRSQRRKLYRLHLQQRSTAPNSILRMAEKAKIPIDRNASVRFLDTVSDNRPHNGVVLDASRLPAPPVLALGKPDVKTGAIGLTLDRQSAEDVLINGSSASLDLPAPSQAGRHPFIIMLDGILDEGNLGSIMRTAHFYGADAVAIATATCASINSPIVAKASSGACEAVKLLGLPKPSSFVLDSAKAGWRVYAAVAPGDEGSGGAPGDRKQMRVSTREVARESPLRDKPVILMLGAEGEGLRANLVNKAHCLISIERGAVGDGVVDVGVDSLNVGVAAGVLMEAFLRTSKEPGAVKEQKEDAAASVPVVGELGF